MTSDIWSFQPENAFQWIIAFCLFEIPMALFYWNISKKGDFVRKWYRGDFINIWNVLLQDAVYVIVGIIIAMYLLSLFHQQFQVPKTLFTFLAVFIAVQIIGDLTFASILLRIPSAYTNKWVQFFKDYIRGSQWYALFGDTLYVIAWTLTYYLLSVYIQPSFSLQVAILCTFFFLASAYSIR